VSKCLKTKVLAMSFVQRTFYSCQFRSIWTFGVKVIEFQRFYNITNKVNKVNNFYFYFGYGNKSKCHETKSLQSFCINIFICIKNETSQTTTKPLHSFCCEKILNFKISMNEKMKKWFLLLFWAFGYGNDIGHTNPSIHPYLKFVCFVLFVCYVEISRTVHHPILCFVLLESSWRGRMHGLWSMVFWLMVRKLWIFE